MFNKIKEKKGGFTLVELIIVLVILAILAAFLVPTLTGYVDRANEKSLVSETRLAVMAAQTLVDEEYAVKTPTTTLAITTTTTETTVGDGNVSAGDIAKLAELKNITATSLTEGTISTTGKITKLVYTANGKKCTYTYTDDKGSKYEVTKVN